MAISTWVQGVTLKAEGAQVSDAQLVFRPTPEIKTVKEVISNLFAVRTSDG